MPDPPHHDARLVPPRVHPAVPGAIGAGIISFAAIFVRLADVSPATAATFRCLYALPLLVLIALPQLRRHGWPGRTELLAAIGAGAFFAADLVVWHRSIADIGAGLATVLANMQVVLVGLIALAMPGMVVARRELAAIGLVVPGVVLCAGVIGGAAYGDNPTRGAVLGVVTAVCYTGFLLLLRRSSPDPRSQALPLLVATATATIGAALAGIVLGELDPVPTWPAHGWLLTLALTCQVLAWLLISRSLVRLRAVAASVLLTIQPVCALLLGIIILGEQPSPGQLAGAALIVAGILVALSARSERPGPGRPSSASPDAPAAAR